MSGPNWANLKTCTRHADGPCWVDATTGEHVLGILMQSSYPASISMAEMYGYTRPSEEAPADPLTQPLLPQEPSDWAGREQRVAWCLRNLTRGEKAKLYRLLYNAEGLRLDQCAAIERAERDTLLKARGAK